MYQQLLFFIIISAIVVAIVYRRQILSILFTCVREITSFVGGSDGGDKVGGRRKVGKKKRKSNNSGVVVKDLKKYPRSKSEAQVVKYLEEILGSKFPSVNPDWLVWRGKTLELDGFNGDVALEFSGPLHTKWFSNYETYAKYFGRIVKDIVKLRLTKKRGVHLIVVDASLPSRHWRNYVLSRLYDFGKVEDRPYGYIYEQTPEVFRNFQLEEELGLTAEMDAALKL